MNGIYFNDIHSYYDLDLILSEVDIPPAKPKTTYIDIPGADGSLDLTEAHGEVKFSDRECTFTFTVNPDETSLTAWEEKKTEVSNLLNGKVFKITLDKDDEYYYQGRCEISEYLSNKTLRQIVVIATVNPYKFKQNITKITAELTDTQKTVYCNSGRKSVSPLLECSNNNTVIVFNSATFNLSAGTHKILDIRFVEGTNILTVSGKGTLSVSYQEAEL